MKIAIMTQPLGNNYGGIMQAWALQQVLKRMGHQPVTIDRQPDQPSFAYKAARLAYRAGMKAIGKRKAPINIERNISRHSSIALQHTQEFISKNINLSSQIHSTLDLITHFQKEGYEAAIVGSDQTWRPKYSPNIYNFFLDFLKEDSCKKIAYASSFGVDNWEFTRQQTKRCSALAGQFASISVREASGIELCQNYLKVKAAHVLDPTMLLNKNDYEALIGQQRINTDASGIYTYLLDETQEKLEIVKRTCQLLNESAYSNQARHGLELGISGNLTDYTMPMVEDWLSGFANAKFVITDSFHGMVFSIIFRKPFLVIRNSKRGATRFISLLNQLNLSSRLIEDKELFDFSIIAAPLSDIDTQIKELQKYSMKILSSSL